MAKRTAAQLLVSCLQAQQVRQVFCVPGESYLQVLDALLDSDIDTIACRHEAGAAIMAEAQGKLTARPGVAFVTRGPGATHASIAIHTAKQDSTPLILFVGQVARGDKGRDAFQEVDYVAAFGSLAKWAVEVDAAVRLPEIISRAFATAMQGRPGPVVVALPEDMLDETAEGAAPTPIVTPASGAPGAEFQHALTAAFESADAPLIVVGGSGWSAKDVSELREIVEAASLPVALSFRRKDLLDNRSPSFVGDLGFSPNPRLVERVRNADMILALGARLGDVATSGYTLFDRGFTAERLVHVHPDAFEIGRVWPTRLAAIAHPSQVLPTLRGVAINPKWRVSTEAARRDYLAFVEPVAVGGAVNLSLVFGYMRQALPDDAIVANGAGNFAAWLHRFFPCHAPQTMLAPTSGAMGYGFPAALGAKRLYPQREVVAVAGDGDFLMTSQDLATAVRYKIGVLVIVVDNGSYGTIRMHQERRYPGRVSATDLTNPDFVAYAHAFGAYGRRVESDEEFAPAFAEARAHAADGAPALLHLVTDVADIAPGRRI